MSTHPIIFPAELDEFVRLIVRAKTPADGQKRFRDFLRDEVFRWHHEADCKPERENGETPAEYGERLREHQEKEQRREHDRQAIGASEIARRSEDWTLSQIQRYKLNGIGEAHWQRLAEDYRHWWQGQLSKKARVSALAGKKPLARKKRAR